MSMTALSAFEFFADLPFPAGEALCQHLVRLDLAPNVWVIREGDAASSMYLLTQGRVRVLRGTSQELLDTLEAPNLFGEMALVAATPRLASVVTDAPCVLYEIGREAVRQLAKQFPIVRDALLAVHATRLMSNIVAANPLFAPMAPNHQRAMAEGFVTQTVAPGTVLLRQDEPGIGLYILLRGRCEVLHEGEAQTSKVSELSEGDVFGEISLVLFDRPCTATVRAMEQCVVLLLPRELFQGLVMPHQKVREEIIKLALARLRETNTTVARRKANLI